MINDISNFIKSISFMDYVFFFTVVFLMILIVCLIYFIRINEEVLEKEEKIDTPEGLKEIAEAMKNAEEKKPVTFTSYEKEQEEKAIISYEELLNKSGHISYVEENRCDDVLVKRVDMNSLFNPIEGEKVEAPKIEVRLMSFEKEEEFLRTLKELQKNLL